MLRPALWLPSSPLIPRSIPRLADQAVLQHALRCRSRAGDRNSSSSNGQAFPNSRQKSKKGRRIVLPVLATSIIAGYLYDRYFQASALERSLFTAYTGLAIAVDYKLNFRKGKAESIDGLHQRVADRLHHLCITNQGLYIKLGQALGMQSAVLPKPYREAFANIFDSAPYLEYSEILQVFKDEFGQLPNEVFDEFEEKPIASASIAQVHRAKIKGTGEIVAVKVQRPEIVKQMEWDLFSYKCLMRAYEYLFDIPCYWMADYIASRMRLETKFTIEAQNAERTAQYLLTEPTLRNRVIVPKVHWNKTTDRIMTADFMVGACRLNDREQITKWGLKEKDIMQAVTDCFAAMIFKFGHVHADPHYGNVLVRPSTANPKKPEIAIIDHGLYVDLTDEFRHDYSLLWKSLFIMDTPTIDKIARSWGFGSSDMFASATLLRPFRLKRDKKFENTSSDPNTSKSEGSFEAQLNVKEKLKNMLQNEKLIPRELVFLTRCMRMMQANNQTLGSPVNRINILAHWAVAGLADTAPSSRSHLANTGMTGWLKDQYNVLVFRSFLFIIDAGFIFTQVRQYISSMLGYGNEGFEDILQKQITQMARDEMGVELDDAAFNG